MFIDTLIDISKDLAKYKNYSRDEFFTLVINDKLNNHAIEYFKRLSNEDYYLLAAEWGTAYERFYSDLWKLKNLLQIKEETFDKLQKGLN